MVKELLEVVELTLVAGNVPFRFRTIISKKALTLCFE